MQHRLQSTAAMLMASLAVSMAQSTTSNPLNEFIGVANSAAVAISAANAQQTKAPSSSSSTSPTPAAATSASPPAAPHHSGINKTTLIVAVVCAIVGALLLALLLGLCCWCLARRRRRRRQQAHAPIDEEVKTWRSNEPKNPGRDYSPHRNGRVASMEQQPMIPPAAKVPPMHEQHPALRNQNVENPFVPVPPSPRRTAPNSRAGLTDGNVPGQPAYVLPQAQHHLSKPRSRSSSRPRTASNPNALPATNTASRPSTPFGLSGVGQPYEDMHVHVLQTDSPSQELRQSLHHREPIVSPPHQTIHRYDTPPNVSSQSPKRFSTTSVPSNHNGNHTATNSTVDTSSTEGSTSADDWRYNKANTTFAGIPPWEQRQHRYSHSPASAHTVDLNIPPIPWAEREAKYNSPSHSPRHSREQARQSGSSGGNVGSYVEGARRNSRSPATSINGQPRRLRFSDLQADEMGRGPHRRSHGVGEAL